MAWLPVDQSLGHHRKTRQLARELGVEVATAIGYLVLFWTWALDNAPSGVLTGIEAEDMTPIIARNLDPHTFLKGLIAAHFVDEKKHGKDRRSTLHIHDWEEYGGKLCESRAANRERMRLVRAPTEKSRSEETRVDQSRVEPPSPPHPSTPGGFNPETDSFLEPTDEETAATHAATTAALNKQFPGGWAVKQEKPKEAP